MESEVASAVPKLKQLLGLDPYLTPHKEEIERRYAKSLFEIKYASNLKLDIFIILLFVWL